MSLYLDSGVIFSIKLSLKVASCATLCVVILGTPVAYLFSRKNFFLKEVFEVLISLPLVFAPTVTGYILLVVLGKTGVLGRIVYEIFGKTLLFTWEAAVVASSCAAFPIFFNTIKSAFDSIDSDYINVSYTLGRGRFYTFFKIVLPVSKYAFIAGVMLAFARAFGEFGATLMIAGNIPMKTTTIPIEIYNAVSSAQFERANILVVIAAVISCGVLLMVKKLMSRWWM